MLRKPMAAHTEGAGLVSQSPRIDWHRKKSTNIHPYKTQLALGALLCKWDVAAGRRRSPSALQMSAGDGPGPSHASAHVRQLLKPPELGCVCASPPPAPPPLPCGGGFGCAWCSRRGSSRGEYLIFSISHGLRPTVCKQLQEQLGFGCNVCRGGGHTSPVSHHSPSVPVPQCSACTC